MKKILYTQRVEYIESYGETRDCADRRIPQFLFDCGYLPVPVSNDVEIVKATLGKEIFDGIVLVGGNSLVKYGGDSKERDEVDYYLIKYAISNRVPLFGFCRGMQSILDYFDCDLEQVAGHVAVRHSIMGLFAISEVNSYHNQACKRLNPECGLVCEAVSSDGVIEMVSHKDFPIKAVMWHPERENPFGIEDKNIIKELFK